MFDFSSILILISLLLKPLSRYNTTVTSFYHHHSYQFLFFPLPLQILGGSNAYIQGFLHLSKFISSAHDSYCQSVAIKTTNPVQHHSIDILIIESIVDVEKFYWSYWLLRLKSEATYYSRIRFYSRTLTEVFEQCHFLILLNAEVATTNNLRSWSIWCFVACLC